MQVRLTFTKVTFLFDFWSTDFWLSDALTLLACFFFAAFYQYVENRRLRLRSLASPVRQSIGSDSVVAPLLRKSWLLRPERWASVTLFGVKAAIGYLLMLAIMSFNGSVLLAIVLGLAAGYLVFKFEDEENIKVEDNNNCTCV